MILFRYSKISIRYKLMFSYTALFVFILAAICSARYFDARAKIKSEVEWGLRQTVEHMAAMVNSASDLALRGYLRGATEKNLLLAEYYYQQYKLGKITEEEAQRLAGAGISIQRIGKSGYVYCLRSDGVIVAHSSPFERGAHDPEQYPYIKEQINRKEGYMAYDWRDPTERTATSKLMYMLYFEPWDWIITSVAYQKEFTDLIGSKDFLAGINALKPINDNFSVYMMDFKGRYLISSEPASEGDNTPGVADERRVAEMLKDRVGFTNYEYTDVDTGERRVLLEYFITLPGDDWIVVAGGDKGVIYAPLDRLLRNLLIIMVAGTAVVALFSWLVSAHFMNPLQRFKEQIRSAARGNLNARVVPENADELWEIAENFNSLMLGMTEQAYGLEKLVDDRTAEYREQNERLQLLVKESQASEEAASNKVGMFFDLLDSIQNLICYRSREGRFMGCNEAYARICLGVPRHAVLGQSIENFPGTFTAETIAALAVEEQKLYSGEVESLKDKVTINCADGSMRTFSRFMSPLRTSQKMISGVVVVLTDISDFTESDEPVN